MVFTTTAKSYGGEISVMVGIKADGTVSGVELLSINDTPGLGMNAKNPEFLKLLQSGVDVGSAYLVIHKDEIIPAAMQYTAKTVEQKLTNKIIAGGARPTENGNSSQSASVVKSDVSQLSKADRAEIIRRVQRGEKIRF